MELGLGPSIISKAIQHVSGLSSQALRRLYNATGDAGDVAYEAKSSVRTLIPHGALAIPAVYDALLKIAQAKGPGAAKQKQAVVERLLVAAHGEEVRFLVRTLSQNLRVGAVRTTLLSALARALVLTPPLAVVHVPCESSALYASIDLVDEAALPPPPKSKGKGKAVHSARDAVDAKFRRAEGLVRKVYVQHPNYDDIVRALLEVGLDGLAEHAPLSVGEAIIVLPFDSIKTDDRGLLRHTSTADASIACAIGRRNLRPPRRFALHRRVQIGRPTSADPCSQRAKRAHKCPNIFPSSRRNDIQGKSVLLRSLHAD